VEQGSKDAVEEETLQRAQEDAEMEAGMGVPKEIVEVAALNPIGAPSPAGSPPISNPLDAEEALLLALQEEEDHAATVMQRQWRRIRVKRALPVIRMQAKQAAHERHAAVRMQCCARGFLQRTEKIRAFKRVRAARCLQRSERRRTKEVMRHKLLHLARLPMRCVDRALAARDAFVLLERAERTALLPTLLAMHSEGIETLTQAGDLWRGLTSLRRATAITDHLRECDPAERRQIFRLCVQEASPPELLELLEHVSSGASEYWGLSQSELVQSFLEAQPERVASLAQDQLLNGIVDTLPANSVAKSLQRMALYSHLPPIRSMLPKASRAFERIEQAANPPPRSGAYALRGGHSVAGGIFGPPPNAGRPMLYATQTFAPPAAPPQPSPREKPRVIDKRLATLRPSPPPPLR
jgi:hypothetical protein